MASETALETIRAEYPFIMSSGWAFCENAGGSQLPNCVIDAVTRYMRECYCNLNAGYEPSMRATAINNEAHSLLETFVNASAAGGRCLLSSSSTTLIHMIANCIGQILRPDQSVVISEANHEANVGAWLTTAERVGASVRFWHTSSNGETSCPLDALDAVLDDTVGLVALPHVSNLLGEIVDLAPIVARIRERAPHALICVDGVAYAPHRLVDVAAFGVDMYVFSLYKVMGPHMGCMFVRSALLERVTGPNHYFVPNTTVPYKFELGGACHEGCAAIVGLKSYLRMLAALGEGASADEARAALTGAADAPLARATVESAARLMTVCEQPLTERFIAYLRAAPGVHLVGTSDTASHRRVPTVAFWHDSHSPADIVKACHAARIALRCGHMYSVRLMQRMGLSLERGVVRASFLHYNTLAEVDQLIGVLRALFEPAAK